MFLCYDILYIMSEYALNGLQVQQIAGKNYPLYRYSDILKFNTLDELLGKLGGAIILYQFNEGIGHWCCIFKLNNRIVEFFCSFGILVDKHIDLIPQKKRALFGASFKHLSYLMKKSTYILSYNDFILQDITSFLCGYYVGYRLRMRHLSLNQFINIFRKSKYEPDDTILLLTTKYLK